MAVRNPLIIVSGLFQELNTSSDKLNFAGNTTADLSENTNLYYTNARARAAVSVTDSGGDGSLAYNSSTGVITYTGPSAAEVRAHISVASGSGLTYSSGEIGTSAIPNSQLANDDITIGSTAIALGATGSTIAGLTSLASGTLIAGVEDAANAIEIGSGNIIFEGSTANTYETILTAADTTGSDKTITLPNATGTVALTSDIVVTASSTTTFSNKTIALGSNTVSGTTAQFNTALTDGSFATLAGSETLTNKTLTSPAINSGVLDAPVLKATSGTVAGKILFKEGTNNGTNTVTLLGAPATADVVLTLPAETGTILSTASSIANSNLANSSVTIGSTAVSLGATTASIAGVTSITSAAVITDDDGFRVRDNSDSSKQLAFQCSGITTSTTRTLTIPDANGTIATQAYVNAQITAEDLDVQTDSGNFDVDLDSEPLILTGGTGIDTSGSGSTATFAIDSTVATLTGSQTLTNKSLTSPAITGSLSGNAFLDEDNFASDSATKVASQQSIKAYVDAQITAEDLDVQTDSGNFDVDLDSEPLILTGGTGIDTSGSGTTATFAIDATVATLVGSQTLTNKTIALGDNTVSGTLAQFNTAVTNATLVSTTGSETLTNKTLTSPVLNTGLSGTAFLDEDNMASDSATKVASQQSIKAYVDAQITAEDLDVVTDSGNFDVDLDSETLTLTGGTGIDTSGSGTTATFAIDSTVTTLTGSQTLTNKTLTSPAINSGILDAPVLKATSATVAGKILFKEGTDNGTNTVTLLGAASTADVVLTLPAETGTILSTATSIPNSNLANSSVTIGSTAVALGTTAASIAGVTSITSAAVVTDDNGFRIRDNSDNTKQLAFECSGISGSTTRTLTVQDVNGTISLIDATETLTNKTLTAPIINNLSTLSVINNVVVGGDLTVNGTTTTIDTTNLDVEDKNITLGKVSSPSDTTADGGGWTLKGTTDKTFNWVNSTDAWTSSEHIELASGKTFIGDGSTLTALNASNISSGTIAAARVPTLNQNTTGTAAIATTVTVADESSDTSCNVLFTTAATGDLGPKSGTNLTFNSSSGVLTATGFAGALTGDVTGNVSGSSGSTTGNAATATALATARTIGGTSFDGTANIAIALAATATALETARTIAGVSFDGTANISLNNNAITNGAGYLTAVATGNIADDAVTYAKIQNVSATNRILGRDSSGAGVIEEITPANLRTMINVEDGADVTDATNVNAAGAVMESDTSTSAMQFVVDEDNMSSDSATKVPTQQSVKAYVDANAGATEFADNVFRVKDNSDASKKLAFECSGISGSTTRTMTVPDENGTISTESFATAIAVALG